MVDDGEHLDRGPADPGPILTALNARDVDFLVIGGVAVIAHGYGRYTQDLDVIPLPDAGNMARLCEALADLDAVAFDADKRRVSLDLSRPESLAIGNYFLDTKYGAFDLLNGQRPDLKRYRRLDEAAVELEVFDHRVRVISKDDLIAMKREAGRPKDLRDIAALTEVERNPPPGG
ncbi:MAG: hypothetical protein FJW90_05510 [Actinobacteria bacterium]|nr:hypothetical protein [Actinomycetota bacterium]